MYSLLRKKPRRVLGLLLLLSVLLVFGVFDHLFETDFYSNFHYPYDGDVEVLIEKLKNNEEPDVMPINIYTFKFIKNPKKKCSGIQNLRLVYLVKSAPEHFDKRIAIRSTWGYENRFSDVEVRTFFLLGERDSIILQKSIMEESKKFSDLIQGNFSDTYYNNTYKTMMGIYWAKTHCNFSKFYMFVDDDYYVSTKNVLRFIRYPTNYPGYLKEPLGNVGVLPKSRKLKQDFELTEDVRLYTGYVFLSAPHRHYTSRWYVSLKEYPYHMWPPYVTAGAFILSRSVIIDMYYTSFYTKHFRFDDIYIGLLAFKAKIEPYHCDEFYFNRKFYNRYAYNYTIATHGFYDPKELIHIWTEQRSLGHA